MRFEWDEEKNRRNRLKHKVSFETAALVFEDPHVLTQRDPFAGDEERWVTLGVIGPASLLFVVHTWIERDQEEVIRIISARAATPREKRRYEEAQQTTAARDRSHRRYERRRH
jgi:hypothetical protein